VDSQNPSNLQGSEECEEQGGIQWEYIIALDPTQPRAALQALSELQKLALPRGGGGAGEGLEATGTGVRLYARVRDGGGKEQKGDEVHYWRPLDLRAMQLA
jgi:hypothetical protein